MGRILMTLLVLAFVAVCESGRLTEKNLNARAETRQRKETARSEICMEEIGCFYSGSDWESVYYAQKMNWLPDSRDEIATEFRFYAPGEKDVQVIKSQEFAVPDGFDASLNIKFIIHGYKGGNAHWAVKMKDAFQNREKCNVFIVDWSNGAEGFDYDGPAVNTQVVGAETGLFIQKLVEAADIDVSKVHLLGHSLGSHVAGYAGKWVKDKLHHQVGRITGMDPAGPNFRNKPPNKRLDMGDAEFVDVIHTNTADYAGSGFGLPQAVGHFDFYPNGGEDQEGCQPAFSAAMDVTKNFFSNLFSKKVSDPNKPSPIACSHSRAYELVIASIQAKNCGFDARICLSWDNYTSGKCDKYKSVQMGYNADKYKKFINPKKSIKLYLATSNADPYCLDREE